MSPSQKSLPRSLPRVTRLHDRAILWIDVPGRAYTVRKGDTLERVAGRLDSSVSELARLNKLKRPYRLRPG